MGQQIFNTDEPCVIPSREKRGNATSLPAKPRTSTQTGNVNAARSCQSTSSCASHGPSANARLSIGRYVVSRENSGKSTAEIGAAAQMPIWLFAPLGGRLLDSGRSVARKAQTNAE